MEVYEPDDREDTEGQFQGEWKDYLSFEVEVHLKREHNCNWEQEDCEARDDIKDGMEVPEC